MFFKSLRVSSIPIENEITIFNKNGFSLVYYPPLPPSPFTSTAHVILKGKDMALPILFIALDNINNIKKVYIRQDIQETDITDILLSIKDLKGVDQLAESIDDTGWFSWFLYKLNHSEIL